MEPRGRMMEGTEATEMRSNLTTPHIYPTNPKLGFPGYYTLIPLVLLTLIGCVVAAVVYIRRRARLDELRHRLIPLYNYDPTEEQEDWGDADKEEDEELTEPLYREGKLALSSAYGP
ncbi:small integral membrane protein 29-like [Acanthopagrus latus]|uniref:small integral membrane protein 29-like n=1 Tax=Acanthopagrus latus TaxID=8177 RepID=UPI00187BF20E|nr:small integral membrane protein 29-like [Acanthopagrus latus]